MAVNDYSTMTAALKAELTAGLTGDYAGLMVERKLFKPNDLADFERYAIIISPPGVPWDEFVVAVRSVQYIFRVDLWLLVKNWNEELSLFGTDPGALGLFQLIGDVKDLLRVSDLSGLLDKTYDEPAGPLAFEGAAIAAFDSGEKAFIHRARLTYTARMHSFCHPRT